MIRCNVQREHFPGPRKFAVAAPAPAGNAKHAVLRVNRDQNRPHALNMMRPDALLAGLGHFKQNRIRHDPGISRAPRFDIDGGDCSGVAAAGGTDLYSGHDPTR